MVGHFRRYIAYKKAIVALLVFSLLMSFTLVLRAGDLALPAEDIAAPSVKHEQFQQSISSAESQVISATIIDDVGVQAVTLYYRTIGTMTYKQASMAQVSNSDLYSVILEPEELVSPGIEYYIKARDLAGNSLLRGLSFSPLSISVTEANNIGHDAAKLLQSSENSHTFDLIDEPKEESIWGNKWLWVGIGVAVVGAIAAGSGGSSSSTSSTTSGTGSVGGTVPVPQ